MSRALRDPRLRIVLAVVVVAVALLLSWHLVAMVHGMGMMLGLCVTVLAAAATLVAPGRAAIAMGTAALLPAREEPSRVRNDPVGRHPPDEGIRLRL